MPRALFLAYYFPPIGGAGAQRNAKFARYLSDFGYQLTVLTGPGSPDYRWTPIDETLANGIGTDVAVHRIPGPEPPRSEGSRGRAERWLRVRAPWEEWWAATAVPRALELAEEVDIVHASINPYLTARAARLLAPRLRKPLVVDLEDPWTFDEMLVYPSRVHRALEAGAMRRTLAAADAVVMNTPEAAERVRAHFPELRGRPVLAIPNGFDSVDFETPDPGRDPEVFRVVHTGSLHTDLGLRHRQMRRSRRLLGGASPGVDLLTRSHVYLLEALEALRRERPELTERVEIHLVGDLTPEDRQAIAGRPEVRAHGFLPHTQTVRMMRSADLLFLPLHDLPPGQRISIVPCKTYEYLASGRPILAAVPDGDARDILGAAGDVFLTRPADAEAMKRVLAEQVERKRRGAQATERDAALVARFEPRRLTGELAALFDQLCATQAGAAPRTPAPELA